MLHIPDSRLGRFRIPFARFETPKNLLPLFARVVILEVRPTALYGAVEYVAWSPDFSELPPGGAIPVYTPELVENDEGTILFVYWE